MTLANMRSTSQTTTTVCFPLTARLKHLKMDQSDIFREFSEKVQTILASPDPQVILDALRALAEGRAAKLQDGTEIEALSGLGNQDQDQNPPELYTQTITALLRWAVKTFPNQSRWGIKTFLSESADEPNLWETMALLDGPKGYNQRLVGYGLYIDGVHVVRCDPPEARLFAPVVPVPRVITIPSQRQPVQPLDDDLPYIPDFLRGNSTARAVVATRCRFGWERVSVDCLCLYVDADDTASLENSITSLMDLVIIKKIRLRHTADSLSEASKLLAPTGISKSELSKRLTLLRKNPIPRIVRQHGHIYHGQSISLMGQESKGSVGVFLSPCDEESKIYALTAYHAVPFKTADERRIITPGGLDILSQLRTVDKHPENTEALLKQWNEACGYAEYGHIGSTQEGWRSDFTLIRLDHWLGENGQWYEDGELRDLYNVTKEPYFSGTRGIVDSIDPRAGDIVYKDGATTGCTEGKIGLSEVVLFEPGTKNIADEKTPDVVRAKLLSIEQFTCEPGDSGSSVFVPAPQEDGWKWAGQLVSRMIMDDVPPNKETAWKGLMIPQSKVFQALKENTGKDWRMSG